ncbi:hypothetical protein ACFP81_04550 [Deinococcus lacus]|uniref:Uncharacterized protein n=1 Tax=Deinococcus lacus TaxID=392561 RepID=A0ABW1YCV3_9DEIO
MTAHLPQYKSPRIVGSPTLLIHAAEDFANELTRQRPWVKARYEEVLDLLDDHLSEQQPATLAEYQALDRAAYVQSLPTEEQALAAEVLAEFDAYLREWGWI